MSVLRHFIRLQRVLCLYLCIHCIALTPASLQTGDVPVYSRLCEYFEAKKADVSGEGYTAVLCTDSMVQVRLSSCTTRTHIGE
jgi:hypothetical protein